MQRVLVLGCGGSGKSTLAHAADTVIFLDFARWRCLSRVFKRVATNAGRTRADMGPGCPEKLDLEFLRWVWNFNARDRQKVLQAVHRHSNGKALHVLRTPRDVRRFVQSIAACCAPVDGLSGEAIGNMG